MEALNLALFGLLGAGHDPHPFWLAVASVIAQNSGWACVAVFAWAAWQRPTQRWHVLAVMLAAGLASMVSRSLAESLGFPRPFMLGLSPAHIEHGARAALPSTHATVMFTMAFMFMLRPALRGAGWLLCGVALATAWARIYVGVHFPRDIAAGLLLGGVLALGFDAALSLTRRGGPSLAGYETVAARLSSMLGGDRFSLYFTLLFTAAAIGVGLQEPGVFPLSFFSTGGPVENGTIFFYLAGAAMVASTRLPFATLSDKLATCVVLLACAAREAGLQSPLFGLRLLHTRLEESGGLAPTVAIVLGLSVIVVATAWLAKRYRQGWRFALTERQWRPALWTVLLFAGVMLFTNTLGGLPGALAGLGLQGLVPAGLARVLVSLEELLELAVPMLAMLAFFQARRGLGVPMAVAGGSPA
jgi:membrane-associated phospholipid phosphatase